MTDPDDLTRLKAALKATAPAPDRAAQTRALAAARAEFVAISQETRAEARPSGQKTPRAGRVRLPFWRRPMLASFPQLRPVAYGGLSATVLVMVALMTFAPQG
ncbi:MAG: hypothetical protein AAF568_10985, partial [Pseudomonadota bacterium]